MSRDERTQEGAHHVQPDYRAAQGGASVLESELISGLVGQHGEGVVLRACCGWGWQTCFLLQDCTCEGLDDFVPSLVQVLYQLPIFPTSFDYVQLKAGPLRGLLLRGTRGNCCQADMQSGFLNGVPVPWESVLGLEKACTAYSATCSSSDTTLLEAVGG